MADVVKFVLCSPYRIYLLVSSQRRILIYVFAVLMHWCVMLLPYANNKGANQPAHPRSLISTFVVCCLLYYLSSEQNWIAVVAISCENVVFLAFRLCGFSLCRLNCLPFFLVWCMWQDAECDCIGSWSLPFRLIWDQTICVSIFTGDIRQFQF